MVYDLARGLPIDHPYRWDGRKFVQTKLWQPSDLTSSIGAWYDAADADTIIESLGAVSQWDDKSSNGNDVVQLTASEQPDISTRTQNGLPVMDWSNAANTCMRNATPSGIPSSTWDLFFVFKRDDIDVGDRYLITLNGGGSNGQIRGNRFADYSIEHTADVTGTIKTRTDGNGDTNPHILGCRYSGSNLGLWVDGTQTVADIATTGTTTIDQFINVGANAFEAQTLDGWLAEIIVVPYLSAADRQRVEGYLAWKWGLESNLPSGHDYENAPPLY